MLYSQIQNIFSPININLQFYNISNLDSIIKDNIFNITVSLISTEEMCQIKKNSSNVILDKSIEGKFDSSLFASNIYLSPEDMEKFDIKENPWIFINISNNLNNQSLDKLILGSTISQNSNLIYSSERIYHYGQVNKEEKVIYKLIGNINYHLMRLEIGLNSDLIGWSAKRKVDENYKKNDTDLSFVTEKWHNGRGLVTLYIEKGEDIYLTFFRKDIIENENLTNYIFKYISAKSNLDFKNYKIKNDLLLYDENTMIIKANTIKGIPSTSKINYYLKIINEEDYINNELINTIAIKSSQSTLNIKGNIDDDKIIFKLKNEINITGLYEMNIYCHIIGNDYDIEYVSYRGISIKPEEEDINSDNSYLIIILICGGVVLLFTIIICCCCHIRRKRRLRLLAARIAFMDYDYDDDLLD